MAFQLKDLQKVVVGPFQQVNEPTIAIDTSSGITEGTTAFTRKSDLVATPAINQLKDGETTIQVTKPSAHIFTINQGTVVANFNILTNGQSSHVRQMSLQQLTVVSSHPEEANSVINQLFQTPN